MIRNSIRQMLRTPVKLAAFLSLITASSFLLTLGLNLFFISRETQKEAQNSFITIGTVEQKASNSGREALWDVTDKDYIYVSRKIYDAPISDSVLDIEGMPYIHKPKHQPVYGSYNENYIVRDPLGEVDDAWLGNEGQLAIVEVTPYEDSVPGEPVKMHLIRGLYGKAITDSRTDWFWYCEHSNPNPEPLYAGTNYIMVVYLSFGKHEINGTMTRIEEYRPYLNINAIRQYTKDGTELFDSEAPEKYRDIVTEDFYETEQGQKWLAIVEGFRFANDLIPVIPTDSTHLIMPFYDGRCSVETGRDITETEYKEGAKVCLISDKFARNNGLSPGDTLPVTLYSSDYYLPSIHLPELLVNAKLQPYEAFEDSTYTIAGVYRSLGSAHTTNIHKNAVIIPAASVENSDENNIILYGPMQPYNTVFEIENGKIQEFMSKLSQSGIDGLDIRFYDGGYTELAQEFKNMRNMSVILLVLGIITTILIQVFFCWMFIVKQKRRVSIERSLGANKRKCTVSLLAGLLLVAALGCTAGSISGTILTKYTAEQLKETELFSDEFSTGKAETEPVNISKQQIQPPTYDLPLGILSFTVVMTSTMILATFFTCRVLKTEPLKLLANIKYER